MVSSPFLGYLVDKFGRRVKKEESYIHFFLKKLKILLECDVSWFSSFKEDQLYLLFLEKIFGFFLLQGNSQFNQVVDI